MKLHKNTIWTVVFMALGLHLWGQCDTQEPFPSSLCEDAPYGCLEGKCWLTGPQVGGEPHIDFCGAGTGLQNPQYFKFEAVCEEVCFTFTVTDCAGSEQIAIIDMPDMCDQWRNEDVLFCFNGLIGTGDVCASGLIPGETYYLLIDGFSGAVCKYKIDMINRTPNGRLCIKNDYVIDNDTLQAIQGPSVTCSGGKVKYSVTGLSQPAAYIWTTDGINFQSASSEEIYYTFPSNLQNDSIVNLCVYASSGCDTTRHVCKTITVQNIPETIVPDTLICKQQLPFNYTYYDWITKKNEKKALSEGLNQFSLPTLSGCDSLIKIYVTALSNPDSTRIDTALCYQNGNEKYTHWGNYGGGVKSKTYFPNALNKPYNIKLQTERYPYCDSTVILNIIGIHINPRIKTKGSLYAIYPKDRYVDMDGREGISDVLPIGAYKPGDVTYEWLLPDGSKEINNGTLRVYKPGKYTLTICAGKFGTICCQSTTLKISSTGTDIPKDSMHNFKPFIYVPNAFSPNGDGNNDLLRVYDNEQTILNINKMQVFDRSGAIVYEETNVSPSEMRGWDGANKSGKQQKEGVYTYYIEVVLTNLEVKVIRGSVTLYP